MDGSLGRSQAGKREPQRGEQYLNLLSTVQPSDNGEEPPRRIDSQAEQLRTSPKAVVPNWFSEPPSRASIPPLRPHLHPSAPFALPSLGRIFSTLSTLCVSFVAIWSCGHWVDFLPGGQGRCVRWEERTETSELVRWRIPAMGSKQGP